MLQIDPLLSFQALTFSGLEKSVAATSVLALAWCGLLLLVAFGCVIGWLSRGARLGKTAKADAEFTAAFRSSAHLLALFQNNMEFAGSARAAVYQNACRELSWHLLGTDTVDKNYMARLRTAGRITPSQGEAVLRTIRHVTDEVTRPLIAGLDGVAGWSLPLLGVVGSLVCLMDGLGRGETGAGLWTSPLWPLLVGLLLFLFVSIGHRSSAQQARSTAARVRDFSVEIGVALDRMFVDHRQPMEPLPSLGGMGLVEGPNFSQPPAETAPSVPLSPAPALAPAPAPVPLPPPPAIFQSPLQPQPLPPPQSPPQPQAQPHRPVGTGS